MFRILLCMTCCSAPPPSRQGEKRKISSINNNNNNNNNKNNPDKHKLDEENREKVQEITLKKEGELKQLLANQVQAEDDNKNDGTTSEPEADGRVQGKQLASNLSSVTATTEAASEKLEAIQKQVVSAGDQQQQQQAAKFKFGEANADQLQRYREQRLEPSSFGERSLSASASDGDEDDDICAYREEVVQAAPVTATPATLAPSSLSGEQDNSFEQVADDAEGQRRQSAPVASTSRPNVPSTTKIGDYARIEYSPVEDLDSITTTDMSYSRFGSERGARSQAGESTGAERSRANSLKRSTDGDRTGLSSRRSSQNGGGFDSTSISIASQLSNEQTFQQNLTNMLDSANNSNYQTTTFGTIGLPLGPPMESSARGYGTTKTSPETTGAALTSASQDSLNSLGEPAALVPDGDGKVLELSQRSSGAALEQRTSSPDELLGAAVDSRAPLASGEESSAERREGAGGNSVESERVGSPQSFTTTTSGALTNPTPTPSEMSGGSGRKKKRLKAKSLFKRFKPGGSKKSDKEKS